MAVDRLYPLNMTDHLLSQIAAFTYEPVRNTKAVKQPLTPAHFLPNPFAAPLPTPQQRRAAFEQNMAAFAAYHQQSKRPD